MSGSTVKVETFAQYIFLRISRRVLDAQKKYMLVKIIIITEQIESTVMCSKIESRKYASYSLMHENVEVRKYIRLQYMDQFKGENSIAGNIT